MHAARLAGQASGFDLMIMKQNKVFFGYFLGFAEFIYWKDNQLIDFSYICNGFPAVEEAVCKLYVR